MPGQAVRDEKSHGRWLKTRPDGLCLVAVAAWFSRQFAGGSRWRCEQDDELNRCRFCAEKPAAQSDLGSAGVRRLIGLCPAQAVLILSDTYGNKPFGAK